VKPMTRKVKQPQKSDAEKLAELKARAAASNLRHEKRMAESRAWRAWFDALTPEERKALREEPIRRAEDAKAQRKADSKMALQLINLGYKAMAMMLHPDKGGSTEGMARLVTIRNRMKKDWK
jgi:hypothetical protein